MHSIFESNLMSPFEAVEVCLLFVIAAVFITANKILERRFNCILTVLLIIPLYYISLIPLHFDNMSESIISLIILPPLIWIMIAFKGKPFKKAIVGAAIEIIWFVSDYLAAVLFTNIYNERIVTARFNIIPHIYLWILFIVIFAIASVVYQLLSRHSDTTSIIYRYSNYLPFILFTLSGILYYGLSIITNLEIKDLPLAPRTAYYSQTALSILVFILLEIIIFITLRHSAKLQKRELVYKELQKQYELEQSYYENIKKNIYETQKIRHDINNIVQIIKIQLKENTPASRKTAVELADELEAVVSRTRIPKYCGNSIINAILFDKIKYAEQFGIEIIDNIILEENSTIDNLDLSRIFMNLIDNAINALKDYCGDKNKSIFISCKENGGSLYIKCENAFSEQSKAQTKNSDIPHGYGLRIIKEISAKYSGDFSVFTDNGIYTAIAKLELQSAKEKG